MSPNGSWQPTARQKPQAAAPIAPAMPGRNFARPTRSTPDSAWCTSQHRRCLPRNRLSQRQTHRQKQIAQRARIERENRNCNRRRNQRRQSRRKLLQNQMTPRLRRPPHPSTRLYRAPHLRQNQRSQPTRLRTWLQNQMTLALRPRPRTRTLRAYPRHQAETRPHQHRRLRKFLISSKIFVRPSPGTVFKVRRLFREWPHPAHPNWLLPPRRRQPNLLS